MERNCIQFQTFSTILRKCLFNYLINKMQLKLLSFLACKIRPKMTKQYPSCFDSKKQIFLSSGAHNSVNFQLIEIFSTELEIFGVNLYTMFHVTWTTFKFNRNELGTVSAFVMISVPWSN